MVGLERLVLASDDFRGTEIDVLDDTIVIEKDVCNTFSKRRLAKLGVVRLTLRFDVSVADAALVKVS